MWGQSSAKISSLHNSIRPPEMETNPACGCPCGKIRKTNNSNDTKQNKTKRSHAQPSHPMECICLCTIAQTS